MKFNESLAYNKNLRERIDTLRRERVVFDSIYKKLERELHEKKKVRLKGPYQHAEPTRNIHLQHANDYLLSRQLALAKAVDHAN